MIPANALLCVLPVLVLTVCCELCVFCENRNGYKCDSEETTKECGDAGCMTVTENCTMENHLVPAIKKDCAALNSSHVLAITTEDQVTNIATVTYCQGKLCNRGTTFPVITDLGEKNGFYCESCFRNNSLCECHSRDRVPCHGNQRQCFTFIGTVEKGDGVVADYVMKGCMSDLVCVVQFAALPGTHLIKQKKLVCTKPFSTPIDCCGCK